MPATNGGISSRNAFMVIFFFFDFMKPIGSDWKLEWADCAAVQAWCGNLSRKELTRNLSGNIWPQSSQLVEPLWTDPGIKSGINVRELISTFK